MSSIGTPAVASTSGGGSSTITNLVGITSLGQAAMASSLPVVLASNQSAIAVTGGGGTQYADGNARGTATGTIAMLDDGTNVHSAKFDVVSSVNSSTSTLLANATFTGTGVDTSGYSYVTVYVYSDQNSASAGVKIEFSSDNTNWNDATVDTFTAGNAAPNDGQTYLAPCRARYVRVVYTNGAVNQTAFRLNTMLRVGSLAGDVIPVADVPTSTADHAQIVKSAVMGKTTAGGGSWVDVKVNPSGALTTASTTQDAAGNSITSNSTTTVATFGLDSNIRSILNVAPTTAGKLDVKGADGDVFVRQTTAANLNATVVGTGTFATQSTLQTQTDTVMIGGVNIKEINAITPLMGNGVTGTGSLRVTIASDNTAFSVNATLSAETTKVIGTVRNADGAGNLWTSNSTTFTAKFAQDVNMLGTLGTAFSTAGKVDVKAADGDVFVRSNAASTFPTQATLQTQTDTVMVGGVNIKEINAVTPLMGNGTTGTGSLRVTVASDNTVLPGVGAGATGSAVPANASYTGINPQTSLPSAATAGNLVGATGDKYGRQVVLNNAFRDILGSQTTTISASTSETTVITAVASTFLDLVAIFISNTSATAARVDIRDATAGSIIFQIYVPAGDIRGISLPTPWPQTAVNNNWTAQSSASVTDLRVSALFIKNK